MNVIRFSINFWFGWFGIKFDGFLKTFQDLHLALVANSEYTVGIGGDSRGSTKWVLNEVGLEQHIVDK